MKKYLYFLCYLIFALAVFALHQYMFSLVVYRKIFLSVSIIYFLSGVLFPFRSVDKKWYLSIFFGTTLILWAAIVVFTRLNSDHVLDLVNMLLSFLLGYVIRFRKPYRIPIIAVYILLHLGLFFYVFPWREFNFIWEEIRDQSVPEGVELATVPQEFLAKPELNGQVLVLDFWYRRCAYCFIGFKDLQSLSDEYKDNKNVRVIAVHAGVDSEEDTRKGIAKIRSLGYDFELRLDENQAYRDAGLATAYPTQLIVDKKGRVRYKINGYESSSRRQQLYWMNKKIKELLKE